MSIGKRIASLRGSQSQAALARSLGVAQTTVRNYENETRTPDSDFIKAICVRFDVSADWLLFGGEKTTDGWQLVEPASGVGNAGKVATVATFFPTPKAQLSEIIECEKNKSGDVATFSNHLDETRQLEKELREQLKQNNEQLRKNADLQKENGDLRVEIEKLRSRLRESEKVSAGKFG